MASPPPETAESPYPNADAIATLREQYRRARAELDDAKRSKAPSEASRISLLDLKRFVYDSEDLLLSLSSPSPSPSLRLKLDSMSSRFRESHSQMSRLSLLPSLTLKKRLPTGSVPKERSLRGTANLIRNLVNALLADSKSLPDYLDPSTNTTTVTNVTILPLIGVGGVGKTALAQHLFNHSSIQGHFDLTAWIWMYNKRDDRALLRSVAECLTKRPCRLDRDRASRDDLLREVRRIVNGSTVLLVLDDAWKGNEKLLDCLWEAMSGAKEGSVVVITTRDYVVLASACKQVQKMKKLMVPPLEEEDCEALFMRHAFPRGDAKKHPDLFRIGRRLIGRSEGLPLLVRNVARKLKSEYDVKKQDEGVPKSDAVDLDRKEILDSLDSSYRDLSLELKSCLEYCSLFPRGFGYAKNSLVRLWVAEGFIEPQGDKDLEDIGFGHFEELLYRSFFWHSWQDDDVITMPNFVHDFVQSIAEEEYVGVQDAAEWSSFPDVRFSSFLVNDHRKGVKCEPQDPGILRTFLVFNNTNRIAHLELADDSLRRMEHLRVLDLSNTDLEELPEAVSYLKHLHYLSLNGTKISTLPQSICSLHNLQTLGLRLCKNLQNLPDNMAALTSLRHLELTEFHHSFTMPKGIGKLTNLWTLLTFKAGRKQDECGGLKELEGLKNLKGDLCILSLCNVDPQDAALAKLGEKESIKKLTLSWAPDAGESESDFLQDRDDNGKSIVGTEVHEHVDDKQVLDSLKPHTKVTNFTIKSYRGADFPNWIGDASFTKMKFLKLENCGACNSLPTLGLLPRLKRLSIICMPLVRNSSRFCHAGSKNDEGKNAFPSLEILSFKDMPEWLEWSGVEKGDFPKLNELEIFNCPKIELLACISSLTSLKLKDCGRLTTLPEFESLTELELKNCGKIKSLPKLDSLNNLVLKNCGQLKQLPEFGCIERIEIENCGELATIPEVSSLKFLSLYGCDGLITLPALSSLETLTLTYCKNLSSLSDKIPALQTLSLLTIPNLDEVPVIASLKTLTMENCGKVSIIPSFQRIEKLELCACDGLTELRASPSLCSLTLMYCNELTSLPVFPKLENLWVEDCNKIKSEDLGFSLMEGSLDKWIVTNFNLSGFSEDLIQQLQPTFVDDHTLAKWSNIEAATGIQDTQVL